MATRLGRWTIGAAFTFILLLASQSAWAQATATMNGRIVDQAGAVLPGVTVTATNMETGAARDTVTNAEGLYTLPALAPGRTAPAWSTMRPFRVAVACAHAEW